ncbi:hypothetical protein FUAX_15360 [Fulvitalea axinellae]|uniref:Crp/Fnr family transcriptional regulator n=1 Tax=Fulvitalea axinellae TaxID=1182444 RepID=A0AAU9CAK5_9BACT|nr:hypothetical protein FUAX_15360 [Fulvitalea axinellae]
MLDYHTFDNLRNSSDWPSRIFEDFMCETAVLLADRTIEFQTLTAKERYDSLVARYPDIFQRAQLGHIATYLGITLQSLSRIRAQK